MMLCKKLTSYCAFVQLKRLMHSSFVPVTHMGFNLSSSGLQTRALFQCSKQIWRMYGQSENLLRAQQPAPDDRILSSDDSVIAKAVPHSNLVSVLEMCSSVEEQMIALCSILRLTPEDIKKRLTLCDMVTDLLEPFFSDFKVQLFGSSTNSFGFKGCDIDMVLNPITKTEELFSISKDDSEIPTIADVLEGRVTKEYMNKLAVKDKLLFMHYVFLDYYKESQTAPMFISAYVPIIRFVHDRYHLKCDLSCGNWTALVNTKLLYALNAMDERVAPLVMAIRYWGKHCGLIGGGLMFNTYCITLLVIYFLQTRTPPVLPTVDYILSQSEAVKSMDVLDENVLPEIKKIPKSKNTQTVEELFREFFFFYLYFDFSQVICPKTGTSESRDNFAANKRFRLNTICVQDPIKLSHNVSNLVDYRNCKKFAKEMLYATKLFQNKSMLLPQSSPWGLIALFDKPFELQDMLNDSSSWNVDLPIKSANTLNSESSRRSELLIAAETVLRLLEKGLLFKCEVIELEDKSEGPSESGEQLLLRAKCFGKHNTWLGRNSVEITDDSIKDTLDLEKSISLKLSEKPREKKKTAFKFMCNFYSVNYNGESFLRVALASDGKNNLNPVLGVFLKEYLPNTLFKLL